MALDHQKIQSHFYACVIKKDRNYAPTVTAEAVSAALFLWPLNTRLPTKPARLPPATANASARTTWRGGLNANGARSPGIGDAVPGALLMIWKTAAEIPARPPPKKFEQ